MQKHNGNMISQPEKSDSLSLVNPSMNQQWAGWGLREITKMTKGVLPREDETHDGLWADCPHCGWENGVSWPKEKTCTGCKNKFLVLPSQLFGRVEEYRSRLACLQSLK